jgi:outer membrane protein
VKQITLIIFCVSFLSVFIESPAFSQTLKIGYVNSSKILQEFSEAQDAQKKIDAFQQRIQDSIEVFGKEYQGKLKEYQQKEGLMTDQAKKAAQQELMLLEQNFKEFQDRKLSRDGELAQFTAKLLDPIKEKVLKIIAQIAKDEKITFMFDKTDAIQILLYGDLKYDYTYKVIDRLKRGKVTEN